MSNSTAEMKNRTILSAIVFSAAAYFIVDMLRTRGDRLARVAAGESLYERTHTRRR